MVMRPEQKPVQAPTPRPATRPAPAPAAAPASAPAPARDTSLVRDFREEHRLTPQQIAAHKATIEALATLPGPPPVLGSKKREWVAQVTPKLEAAEQALEALRDAAFWHKQLTDAQLEPLRKRVSDLRYKVEAEREAGGLDAPTPPASPFRPLWQLQDACKDLMASGPIGAIVGALLLVPAVIIDMLDAVTRPAQALLYPFVWGQFKWRERQYDRLNPASE